MSVNLKLQLRARLRSLVLQPIDNCLWRSWPNDASKFGIYQSTGFHEISRFYPDLDLSALERKNRAHFDFLIDRFTAYAFDVDHPVIIEPSRGWLIPRLFRIFERSFPLVNDPWDKIKPRPSTSSYLTKRHVTTLDQAISVSFCWHNYYHFLVDTLPQFHLLNFLGIPDDVPVIVPETFRTTRFVREYVQMSSFLSDREFIVQRTGDYVRVRRHTYIAKDTFYSEGIFSGIADLKSREGSAGSGTKVYLRRDPQGTRGLRNDQDLTAIARGHGFEVVDTSLLSLQEQVELFSHAGIVVGTHGAGLTNILFRRGKPLHLLELFPADLTPEHYRNISILCGFDYDRLIGGPMDGDGRFSLDPKDFEQALSRYALANGGA